MNDLSFTQISTLLNNVVEQATGHKSIAPVNTGQFTAVAQTGLLAGYDNLTNSISQVLSRTIFSIRPYYRKLGGLQVSEMKFGNHVRKLQPIDDEWENDNRQPLVDGESVDMYKIKKPKVLQTNFYGQAVYERHITIYKDQLDVAFTNPEEFGRFISMVLINISNQIEQAHETLARGCLANLIGGVFAINNAPQIVHLLSEYNAATGESYTPVSIMAPDVYRAFTQWSFARIRGISSMLTERTELYHQNITGKPIKRTSQKARQRVYLFAKNQFQIEAMVLSDIYHNDLIRLADNETVNYWQSITNPDQIDVQATYMQEDGTLTTADIKQSNVYGVIMDEEAAGYTVINKWRANTPFNADGGYTNMYWHFTDRYWNDFTENCVVLMLD